MYLALLGMIVPVPYQTLYAPDRGFALPPRRTRHPLPGDQLSVITFPAYLEGSANGISIRDGVKIPL